MIKRNIVGRKKKTSIKATKVSSTQSYSPSEEEKKKKIHQLKSGISVFHIIFKSQKSRGSHFSQLSGFHEMGFFCFKRSWLDSSFLLSTQIRWKNVTVFVCDKLSVWLLFCSFITCLFWLGDLIFLGKGDLVNSSIGVFPIRVESYLGGQVCAAEPTLPYNELFLVPDSTLGPYIWVLLSNISFIRIKGGTTVSRCSLLGLPSSCFSNSSREEGRYFWPFQTTHREIAHLKNTL